MRFSPDGTYLYVSAGDNFVRKLRMTDANSDGRPDFDISNGRLAVRPATGGGIPLQTGAISPTAFIAWFDNGLFLFASDSTPLGEFGCASPGQKCTSQGQWGGITSDGTRAVQTNRDNVDGSTQRTIAFYSLAIRPGVTGGTLTPTLPPPGASPTPTPTTPSGGACSELLSNGGFETGSASPWVASSNHAATLIRTMRPHSGTYSAFLGDANNADDQIYQQVSIPAGAASVTLSYWWSRFTQETGVTARDLFTVTLRDSSGGLLATLNAANNATGTALTWYQAAHNLSAYVGRTVRVHFQVTTNGSNPSDFSVDDVSLQTCIEAATGTPTPSPTPGGATPTPTATVGASPTTTLPLTWRLEPGLRVSGEAYGSPPAIPLAPDVIRLDDGRYRMFYTVPGQGIGSAISDDGFTWTVESGIRLRSQRVEGQLHFDVGHPTVVRLADGRWRMYHQTSTGIDTPLRLASAISSDGFSFTQEEGVRIDIGAASRLSFAGHGRAWRAADGSFRMLFSANMLDDTGPSDIALATSPDGLTWTIVEPHLFVDGHDPTLLVNTDQSVTALWMYLDQTLYTSHSADGRQWSTPVEVSFQDEYGQPLRYSSDNNLGDVTLLRLGDGSLRLFTNWADGIRSLRPVDATTPTPTPTPNLPSPYLLAFHACDTATTSTGLSAGTNCSDPRNHRVYLAQSDDGANWSLVPGWTTHSGSVPDVIRRGDTLYVYTPGQVRRYRFSTNTWEDPVQVTLTDPEANGMFVDPSPFVDNQGRLVLFYLLGAIGQDPAGCAPGETTCVKHFHSATEVADSDGTAFVAESGDRVQITISPSNPSSASDPDIFYDGSRYVLYISRGANVQVYTSLTLHGSYTLSTNLPDGYLTHGGGVPAGHFESATARYWTYVHTPQGVIRRAVHASLDVPLADGDFITVLSGSSIGLGASYRVESPGFAVNTAGTTPSATPGASATPTPTATATPAMSQCVRDVNSNGRGDVADIMATAAGPGCLYYLPLIISFWRQPWPGATPTLTVTPSPTSSTTPTASGLNFVPDSGIRVDYASNPAAKVEAGTVYLFYEDRSVTPGQTLVASSSDGLNFSAGVNPTSVPIIHPYTVHLPDGTYRRYLWDQQAGVIRSESSPNGLQFTSDPGVRYTLHSSDHKTYTLEPGTRLKWSDFTEFDISSLNDPVVVRLPDGRHRMYVAAMIADGAGGHKWAIVSATSLYF
jgi:hypothetical protein